MRKRIAIVIIFAVGVFAVALSFSHFPKTASPPFSNETTIEQNHPTRFLPENASVISSAAHCISAFSLPSPFIIQSHLPSCFLFEVFGVTDHNDESAYEEEASLYPNDFFEITFTLIISPNAP